jgi:ABC-type glycerol-3-phosphate transport system substrate-binding protein
MEKKLDRRTFLKMGAGVSAAALLAACGPKATEAPTEEPVEEEPTEAPVDEEPTAVPTAAPRLFGEGEVEIVVWYQDWEGANRMMTRAGENYSEAHPEVTVNLQAIGYGDLFAKLLPSIAAGTEGDVMNMYTNWIVGTDIKQVFLDITEPAGGYQYWEESLWPAALQAIDMPEGKVFYLPWLAGIRGAAMTVNTDHASEADVDYLNFETFEEVIEAGKAMTKWDGDTMTQAGYAINSSQWCLMYNIIWELGGDMFDTETGIWTWASPEGEEAISRLYDIYHEHKTSSYDLYTDEYQGCSEGLISIWGNGAWTAGVLQQTADIPTDNYVTPPIADGVNDDLYPDHIAGFGLSKRLSDDQEKLQQALDFALEVISPASMVQAFDDYSGVCMTKAVYEDPGIEEVAFGEISKRIAEGMWPRGRFNQDHVADMGPAYTELDRGLRGEIGFQEALENMDEYCQEQEDAARERIGM